MIDKQIIDKFAEFVEELSTESNRAAVVLGVSKIDQSLYFILNNSLLSKLSTADELLDGDSPLSTFNARINMCFRIGILDKDFTQVLHIIRKIRNNYAHNTEIRLDKPPTRDSVNELVKRIKDSQLYRDVKQVYFSGSDDFSTEFRVVITVIAIRLEIIANSVNPPIWNQPQSLIPFNYDKVN